MCGKVTQAVLSPVKAVTGAVGDLFAPDIKVPKPPALPEPPKATPTPKSPGPKRAQERTRRQQLAAAGRSSTILTGPLGATGDPEIRRKTLLGS